MILFCGPAFDPIILLSFLVLIPYSIFLVIQGIYRFTRSSNPGKLLSYGAVLWIALFIPFVAIDFVFMSAFPFGVGAGAIPYLIIDTGNNSSVTADYLFAAVGCLLNVIAILNFAHSVKNQLTKGNTPRQVTSVPRPKQTNVSYRQAREARYRSEEIRATDSTRVAKHLADAHVRKPVTDLKLNPVEGLSDDN